MAFDVMNFATEPAKAVEGFHGILYGEPGCGKTSTMDDPIFKVAHIDLEGGSTVLRGAENVIRWDVPQIATKAGKHEFEIVQELGAAIRANKFQGFDMVSIDSLTRWQEVVKDYVATVYVPNRAREIKNRFGAQSDWGDLANLIVGTFRAFHSLTKRGKDSIHIMWLAHVGKQEQQVTESMKKLVRTYVQLQGSSTPDTIMSIVDGYFYMFSREGKDASGKPNGVTERGIMTDVAGAYQAKARISKRKEPLPRIIMNPVWSDIFDRLGYQRLGE